MTTILLFLFMLGGLILAIVTIAPIWAAYGAPGYFAYSLAFWTSIFALCAVGWIVHGIVSSIHWLTKVDSPKADPRAQIRKAADQRHPGAQYSIGVLYSKGHGVPQNDREAAAWFRIAADQGHAEAQYALSRCYEQGRGVKQNPVHAYAWMSLAGNASPGRHAHALVSLENSMNQAELIDAQRLAADYRQHGSRTRLIRTRELVQRAKDSQKTGAAS